MTQEHPITPPPELVQQWINEENGVFAEHIATQAARWGSDQELEACREWLRHEDLGGCGLTADWLYEARRPKPPSLKAQALHALLHMDQGQHNERAAIVRRALEQLDD